MSRGDINRALRISTDGTTFVGNAFVKHPDIKFKTEGDENSFIAVEEILGLEAMTAELSFTTYAKKVAEQVGICNGNLASFVCGGSFEDENCVPTSIKCLIEGKIVSAPGGWEQKATGKVDTKVSIAVHHYRLEIGGKVVYDIDRDGDKMVVNGTDQMLIHRLNSGYV